MKLLYLITLLASSFAVVGQAETANSDIWGAYQWTGDLRNCFGYEEGVIEFVVHKDLSVTRYDYSYPGDIELIDYKTLKPSIIEGKLTYIKGNIYLFIEYRNRNITDHSWVVSINKRRVKFFAIDRSNKKRPYKRLGLRLMRM